MSRVVDISVRHAKTKVSAVSVRRVVHALDKLKGYRCPAGSLSIAFLGDKGYQPRLVQSLMQTAKIELPFDAREGGAERLASLFDLVENNKDALGIRYYHLAPQSLEGIFIQLSEKVFDAADTEYDE